jgi:endo-1,4-beta-xylanase
MENQAVNTKPIIRLFVFSCAIFIAWAHAGYAANLLNNPGFELGTTRGWTCRGGTLTAISGSVDANSVHSGSYYALISDRTDTRQGPVQSILGVLKSGKYYRFSAWVKLQDNTTDQAAITVTQTDGTGTNDHDVVRAAVYDDRWTSLSGLFNLNVTGSLTALDLCIEGPRPGVRFCVDDVSV